jgi:hypothetical protein
MTIKLAHHDDGKKKWQSHEIRLFGEYDIKYDPEVDLFSNNVFDVTGYGKTQEEALKDFTKKMTYLLNGFYKELEKAIAENKLTDNIVEVDCFGKEINT